MLKSPGRQCLENVLPQLVRRAFACTAGSWSEAVCLVAQQYQHVCIGYRRLIQEQQAVADTHLRCDACWGVPQAFWQRYQELPDWEKVIKNIERGEQKIQRQADIMQAVRTKLERYKNPWQELKVGAGWLSAGRVETGAEVRGRFGTAPASCCYCIEWAAAALPVGVPAVLSLVVSTGVIVRDGLTCCVAVSAVLCVVFRSTMVPTRARHTLRRRTASSCAASPSMATAHGMSSRQASGDTGASGGSVGGWGGGANAFVPNVCVQVELAGRFSSLEV